MTNYKADSRIFDYNYDLIKGFVNKDDADHHDVQETSQDINESIKHLTTGEVGKLMLSQSISQCIYLCQHANNVTMNKVIDGIMEFKMNESNDSLREDIIKQIIAKSQSTSRFDETDMEVIFNIIDISIKERKDLTDKINDVISTHEKFKHAQLTIFNPESESAMLNFLTKQQSKCKQEIEEFEQYRHQLRILSEYYYKSEVDISM